MNPWLDVITCVSEPESSFPRAREIIDEGMNRDALKLFIETASALRGSLGHLERVLRCENGPGCQCRRDAWEFGRELNQRMP